MSKRKQKDHMANIAIKYRIYPTLEQRILLARTFGCTRKVWNLMLADRNAAYEKDGSTLKPTPAQYKDECPYLKEVDSLALCNAQLDLERAFSQFFDACKGKRKGKLGKPKFKSRRHSSQSYTTNVVGNNLYVEDNRIRLPKVGFIEAVIHRTVEETYGYITKYLRETNNIAKSHTADARCISKHPKAEPCADEYVVKPIRRHNRRIHEANFRKGGIRRRTQSAYEVKGFRLWDRVKYDGREYVISGKRTSGYFKLKAADGTSIDGVSYKKLQLLEIARGYLIERKRRNLPLTTKVTSAQIPAFR